MLHQQGVANMQRQQNLLARTQNELASGQKLSQAADDPAAWSTAAGLDQGLARLGAYQSNLVHLQNRLGTEENTLAGAGDLLQRASELAVQLNNGSYSASERAAIAQELQQHLQGLLGLANSQDGEGRALFAGTSGVTTPFSLNAGSVSYAGDTRTRVLDISPSQTLADGDDGATVFMDVPGGGDVFSAVQDLITLAGQSTTGAGWQTAYASALDGIQRARDHVTDMRASVGSRLRVAEDVAAALETRSVQIQESLSELRDLDYAEATARLNLQQTALQAAMLSYQRVQGLSLFDYLR